MYHGIMSRGWMTFYTVPEYSICKDFQAKGKPMRMWWADWAMWSPRTTYSSMRPRANMKVGESCETQSPYVDGKLRSPSAQVWRQDERHCSVSDFGGGDQISTLFSDFYLLYLSSTDSDTRKIETEPGDWCFPFREALMAGRLV